MIDTPYDEVDNDYFEDRITCEQWEKKRQAIEDAEKQALSAIKQSGTYKITWETNNNG